MPAEVILPQAQHLAEVLARDRKEFAVDIERDPVDDPSVPHRTPLGLPALVGAEPEGRQVVDQFRRPGDRAPKAPTDRVGSGVVFIVGAKDEGGRQRGGLTGHGPVIPVGNVAAILVDGVVVDLIVERKLIDALRCIGVGKLGLKNHLVGEAVDVPHLAFEVVIDPPHRQTRPNAHLAIGPIDRLLGEILPPVG